MKEKVLFIEIYGSKASISSTENKEITENFDLEINGFQKGKIIDKDLFLESFNTPKLQRVLNFQNIDKLIFGISPQEIYSKTEKKSIFSLEATKPVEEKDLIEDNLIQNDENTLLHSIPLGFILDNKDLLSNPVGMHASKLEIVRLNISVDNNFVNSLVELCRFLNISCPVNIVSNSLAMSNEIIDRDNKDFGCFHINIGEDLTELSMIQKNKIFDLAVIPVGKDNFIRDIEITLDIAQKDAKILVENFGTVMPELIKENEHLLVHTSKGQEEKISNKRVGAIMRERANELLQISKKYFDEKSRNKISTNRVFISGNGSNYDGFDSLMKYVFQYFIYRNPDEKDISKRTLINFYFKECKNLKNFNLKNYNSSLFNSKIIQSNNLIKSKIKKLLKIG
ncbi:MAG: cell division FtsA domain-containing protein [Dehalococcoidia bacterium]|tara:strand:- start:1362 stop:2549 length:1188 start_codon:yes stop_codon:yes gene_type:complete